MRKVLSVLIILVCVISLYGFRSMPQTSASEVVILNRSDQPTLKITDGDTIHLQIKLSQASPKEELITFTLGEQGSVVGTCIIAAEKDTCQTESFLSLGWYWDADGTAQKSRVVNAHDSANSPLGQSDALQVLPRPVVLVHGFISTWDTWKPYLGPDGFLSPLGLRGFAVGDGQVDGVMDTGSLTKPTGRTNSIAQNAEIEGQYIDGVKKATGAEMVDLVGHSMGGMISRYYIDRVMKERDVAQLIMLGSPMGGSDCSVLPATLGFYLPASIEIRQSYMQGVFNNQIIHRHGVEFYDLGGTPILEPFKSPCTDVPNDTVVSFGSINAIELNSEQIEVIHSELTYSDFAFEKFVRPLLQKSAGTFNISADPKPTAARSESLQFTRVYKGKVEKGGSTELTINIDPNVTVASFALFDPTRSVTVSVVGASGKEIPLDTDKNGFVQVDDPSSMIYLGYGFANPKAGLWRVTVHASDSTPVEGADFAVSVYFVGGAVLRAQSSTLIPKLGEEVQLSAEVSMGGQSLEIKQAQAVIRDPDGNVEVLEFPAGKSISTAWKPKTPGAHGVDIIVTSAATDGAPVERTAFLSVEVQPNPSQFQVTGNLVLVIGLAVLVLGLILFAFVRTLRKVALLKR